MRAKKRNLLLVGVVLAAALAGGLMWATHSQSASSNGVAPMQGNFDMSQAQSFTNFPLYDAGDSVAGYQLNAIERTVDVDHGTQNITFLYGDCVPPKESDGSYDGGCPPPVQVQVWPACARNPALYGQSPGQPTGDHVVLRDVPALAFGGQTELYTGTSTVVIFANDSLIPKVAAALQGVNNSVPASSALPAPAAAVMDGTLKCG